MDTSFIATGLIILTFVSIAGCLGAGLFSLLRDDSTTGRTLSALKLRVTLSFLLFITLLIAVYQGWITPNPTPL